MKLQTLKYFVSLSITKNFTKSAEECFISQPALSRSISEFENELGCRLFIRNSRFVELTEEGEVCLIEAKKVLKQCDILIEKVNVAKHNFEIPIKIGYIIYGHIAIFNRRLKQIADKETLKIETEYDTLNNTYNKLISDEIDIAILPEGFLTQFNDLETFKLQSSRLYILVSSKNKLYKQEEVTFNDIKDQKFIGWDTDDVPRMNSYHSKICEKNGFKPEFVAYGKKMGDIMTLSIINNAIGFASSRLTIVDSNEFKLLPVSDSEEVFGFYCVWKKCNGSRSVKRLIELLRK